MGERRLKGQIEGNETERRRKPIKIARREEIEDDKQLRKTLVERGI